jgi:hypothetical protein
MLADRISSRGIPVNLQNHGHPGAGNAYIGTKPMIDSAWIKKDLAIVMWSGLTRKDVLIDQNDTLIMNTLDNYGFVRMTGPHSSYVLSGGMQGSWTGHPTTKEIFNPMYKYSNKFTMAQDTLIHIINLQNYFKANKITYLMSSYVNYWTRDKQVAELDYGLKQYPGLLPLINQIDFTRWVFANNNQDGIYELAKDINQLEDDNFHPNFIAHAAWTDLIVEKLEVLNFFA